LREKKKVWRRKEKKRKAVAYFPSLPKDHTKASHTDSA
jgi:hypothetical protein